MERWARGRVTCLACRRCSPSRSLVLLDHQHGVDDVIVLHAELRANQHTPAGDSVHSASVLDLVLQWGEGMAVAWLQLQTLAAPARQWGCYGAYVVGGVRLLDIFPLEHESILVSHSALPMRIHLRSPRALE